MNKTIINVTPGLIPIPPNGWGAVEKIIWEIHKSLLILGHDSQIKYLDEVDKDSGIVHIHVANLANMAHERGIPYYFTFHDHHAYLHGKDSVVYKENLLAMKNAVKSFVPAKYLVDYFDGMPEYFSHGVNTLYFTPDTKNKIHKLLCVANNGYAHDATIDRKGFGIAIEAAQRLGLPITIAGPSNNKHYFEKNAPIYDKLTILYDLSEEELLKVYRDHTIFLHPSELEAGHPNLTILEALSCGLPVIGTFESNNSLRGLTVVNKDIVDITLAIQEIILKYNDHQISARKQAEDLSWMNQVTKLLTYYKNPNNSMKKTLLHHYSTTQKLGKSISMKINHHNIDGLFVEIIGGNDVDEYDVNLMCNNTNQSIYKTVLKKNMWAKASVEYFVDWKIVVQNKKTGKIEEITRNLKNARVFICIESKSLGDTLAWIPYVEEFRKRHQCNVICSTFWNELFKDQYTNIEFANPGETVHNIQALYRIGIFYKDGVIDTLRHPNNPIEQPLQKVASDILGLPFEEIRPLIKKPKHTDSKQVSIAIHSTAQSKYWNNPTGWQTVVDWLISRGYTVKLLSNEGSTYMGNNAPVGVIHHTSNNIESVIEELSKSKLFLGISSGLSWLSWAVGIPTVLISGFTYDWNEMQDCIRVAAPIGSCSGCYNRHKFNPGDWNWCPDHKGTPRQFECSKNITAEMVIQKLNGLL